MTDDLVKRIKDRSDWLVDAVATSTQNRQFLRGEPECDDVACEVIRLNGEKAMMDVAKPLADRIEVLEADLDDKEAECRFLRGAVNMTEAKLEKAEEALEDLGFHAALGKARTGIARKAQTTLKELKGGVDE